MPRIGQINDWCGDPWDIYRSRPDGAVPIYIGYREGAPRGRGAPACVILTRELATYLQTTPVKQLSLPVSGPVIGRLRVLLGIDQWAAKRRRGEICIRRATHWERSPGVAALLRSRRPHEAVARRLGCTGNNVRDLRTKLRHAGYAIPKQPKPASLAALAAGSHAPKPKSSRWRRHLRLSSMRRREYIYHARIDQMDLSEETRERYHAIISMYTSGLPLTEIASECCYRCLSSVSVALKRILTRRRNCREGGSICPESNARGN